MRHAVIFLSALCFLPAISAQPPAASTLLGFSSTTAKTELDLEKRFRAIPDPERMRANMKLLSARPHHVGSPYDKQNAEWILAQYQQWGWVAHIETFQVLFPTPKNWKSKVSGHPEQMGDTDGRQARKNMLDNRFVHSDSVRIRPRRSSSGYREVANRRLKN